MLTLHATAVRHVHTFLYPLLLWGYGRLYLLKSVPGSIFSKEHVNFGNEIPLLFHSHFVHGFAREVPQVHWIRMHDTIAYGMIDFDPGIR